MNENTNINYSGSVPPVPPIPKKPKREYNAAEMVFAWLSIVFGYILCRVFPVTESPLGGLMFTVSLYLITAVILKIRGAKFTAVPVIFAISAIAMQAALILSSNSALHFFVYTYGLVVYLYFIYSVFGNSIEGGFSNFIAADFIKAALVMPFESFGNIFGSLSASMGKKGGKFLLRVLLGVAIAIIPTAIIIALLSYDKGFTDIMGNLFNFDFDDVVSQISSIAFGLVIAMYTFGLFVSSVDKKLPDNMSKDKCRSFLKKLKITPAVTVCIAVVPILVVYIIFFVSQWQYYVSGFSGVLPKDFSYAEYAREGFFQLCTVSFINLLIITAISLFMNRSGKAPRIILKVISLIFAVATLVLIATALSKMYMYIDFYGLTPRRVYATWGMLVLTAIFLLIIIKQFLPCFKLIAAIIFVVVILFGALALSGVDSFIAEYNVDRYVEGSLDSVDVDAVLELGDAGIEQLVRLAKVIDAKNGTDIASIKPEQLHTYSMYTDLVISLHSFDYSDCDFFSYTIPQAKAKAALAELGIEPWEYEDFCKLPYNLRPDA